MGVGSKWSLAAFVTRTTLTRAVSGSDWWQVLLDQLVPELGQLDPWTVRLLLTFWPPSSTSRWAKVGRDGIIWAILLVFAVVCFVPWSACLRNWALAWFWNLAKL